MIKTYPPDSTLPHIYIGASTTLVEQEISWEKLPQWENTRMCAHAVSLRRSTGGSLNFISDGYLGARVLGNKIYN